METFLTNTLTCPAGEEEIKGGAHPHHYAQQRRHWGEPDGAGVKVFGIIPDPMSSICRTPNYLLTEGTHTNTHI